MIFSSLTFAIFLVVVLGAFFVASTGDKRRRLLLVASYVFYGWWDPRFLLLIFASSAWSWWCGNHVHDAEDPVRRRRWLVAGLSGDLGSLAFFKYANFFIESFESSFGLATTTPLDIVLPVGISFFTFQSMSYTIDIYRGTLKPCRDLERFLLFVSFFPQLVAGPIVRASEFLPQLDREITSNRHQIARGLQIFLVGMFQKIVLADNVAVFVDPVFADPTTYAQATLWLGLFAYSLQILCDFSGYSLMAIGCARMFGFVLPDNFDMPYLSRSITEFWRRWHMSLSRWLRDYLYISLGGNRHGPWRTRLNVLLTMLLGGLWHGAGWNFVLWGFMHGLGLFIHKAWEVGTGGRTRGWGLPWHVAAWAITLLFALLLWIPFRCRDFPTTLEYLHGLFVPSDAIQWLHTPTLVILGVAVGWHVLRLLGHRSMDVLPAEHPTQWKPLVMLALLVAGIVLFAQNEAAPFIYFQF